MRIRIIAAAGFVLLAAFSEAGFSYPPAGGILGKSKNCLACHIDNGPWKDDPKTIIDILDKETMKSLRQPDAAFLIEMKRGQQKTILTIIGRTREDEAASPYRNAWLYIDSSRIESGSMSKFASGWAVNLPMACRIIGDVVPGFEGAKTTALPMTIQALDDAKDAEVVLQVMLTKGEAVKGKPKEGMTGSYFERKVKLKIME